jgi:hypothetical protein
MASHLEGLLRDHVDLEMDQGLLRMRKLIKIIGHWLQLMIRSLILSFKICNNRLSGLLERAAAENSEVVLLAHSKSLILKQTVVLLRILNLSASTTTTVTF